MNSCLKKISITCAGLIIAGSSFVCKADSAKIKETGVIKAALYNDFVPFSDGRQASKGIDVDIAQALANKMNLRLSVLPFDAGENLNDDLRNMVWKGHYLGYGPADFMMHVPFDNALSAANPQVLIFAPYFREMVVMAIDTTRLDMVTNLSDLKDKPLCAVRGDAGSVALLSANNGVLAKQIKLVDNLKECASLMKDGKVDVIAARRSELEYYLRDYSPAKLLPIESPVIPPKGWTVGIATKKDDPALQESLSKAMNELRDSGELSDIFTKYGVKLVSP